MRILRCGGSQGSVRCGQNEHGKNGPEQYAWVRDNCVVVVAVGWVSCGKVARCVPFPERVSIEERERNIEYDIAGGPPRPVVS